ncbi:protein phosphatase 2C domain-containing protein [Actinomadura parmotrematis]|uniref:protein phosphatase 2C domain-containing protein n=1 Tax=Actinomadura parmotrematis TaxID=2864039 RepID=UPI0027E2BDCA|nr:protein phosphatase 2C domain-containing protein [Actinomadura parmotrematis]
MSYASEPTPGRPNEDHVVAGPGWVAVLDGATARPGVATGCVHDPGWLVRRLGGALAARLAPEDGTPLPDVLAGAIEDVGARHGGGCDLGNPDSPSATVALLRRAGGDRGVDWLVLADSPVLVDDGTVRVVKDDRVDRLPSYTDRAVRDARNSPGGFWVASTRPEAAYEALTGRATGVRRAAVLSDGAARLVERFGLADWTGLLDLLDGEGPRELIRRTRAAEAAAGAGTARRGKLHDDATAVLVRP